MNGCLAIGLFFMGIALLFIHPVIDVKITGIVADHLHECLDRLGAPKETFTGC